MDALRKVVRNPYKLLFGFVFRNKYLRRLIPDKAYLKLAYRSVFGKKLNLKNPSTFNAKLQWLKLYDRNPKYTTMVDKYEAKEYVSQVIGKDHIIPTFGVWDSFEEIDFDSLPNQFVLKCTHDSGGLVICREKNLLDIDLTRKKIEQSLSSNFFYMGREWPYKNVKPRIIAEKLMFNNNDKDLKDYKFFCFGGVVKCYKVDFGRFTEHHANYYDKDGNMLEFGEKVCPPKFDMKFEKDEIIEQMIELAEKLAKGIPFIRVDFYNVNGQVYFGELTFYPASGFGKFTLEDWDRELGKWLKIDIKA